MCDEPEKAGEGLALACFLGGCQTKEANMLLYSSGSMFGPSGRFRLFCQCETISYNRNPNCTWCQSGFPETRPRAMKGLREASERVRSNVRPWTPWLDRNAYEKPLDVSAASVRVRQNVHVFVANYMIVVTGCVAIVLLTNPVALLTLAIVGAAAVRALAVEWNFGSRVLTDAERSACVGFASFLALFVLTDAGPIILSGTLTGMLLVAAHAATYTYEDLFN